MLEKFQSGRADTLFSNTLVNMTICNLSYKIEKPVLMIAQGDDFACYAKKITRIKQYKFLKFAKVRITEFTSDLITQQGLIPSVVKKCGKLVNRPFDDQASLDAYRLAVKDWFTGYYTIRSYVEIIKFNAYKYEIAESDIKLCLDFMLTFANTDTFASIRHHDFIRNEVPTLRI